MKNSEISLKNLIRFSIPNILVGTIEPLASLVDTYFTAQLTVSHLAALGANVALFSAFGWIFSFINHLSVNKMARNAHNAEIQKMSFWNGNVLSLASTVLCISTLLVFQDQILAGIFSLKSETKDLSSTYYNIRLVGFLFFFLSLNYLGALKGLEKVKLTFYISFFGTVSNILISYLLFNYYERSLASLAIGTVLEYMILSIVSLFFLLKSSKINLFSSIHIDLSFLDQSLRDAKNIFLRTSCLTMTFLSTSILLSNMDETFLAAHQIMLEIWLYVSIVFDGVASTAQIKVGKFSGGKKEGLIELPKQLMKLSMLASLVIMGILILLKPIITQTLILNEEMLSLFIHLWPYFVISQFINSLAYIFDGILYGFEDYSSQRNIIMTSILFCYLPLAAWGYQSHSFQLIWFGLIGMNCCRAVLGVFSINKAIKAV